MTALEHFAMASAASKNIKTSLDEQKTSNEHDCEMALKVSSVLMH